MGKAMRTQFILLLMFYIATPAGAAVAHESGTVGPYVVSFDMNTTMQYTVYVESPMTGETSMGIKFTRYNLTIDSADYTANIVLTRYDEPMIANITANEYIVYYALENAGADEPALYQPQIDGQPGVLGNFRFQNEYLGNGQYQQGDLVVAAAYSPDGRVYKDGVYRGRTDCRIISTYPWEIIRDLIYTLHIAVPAEDMAASSSLNQSSLLNQSSPFDNLLGPASNANQSAVMNQSS